MFPEILNLFENNEFKKIKLEDNFFSIGMRSFYENSFTEVLRYILDSETQFNGRKEFIEMLLGDTINSECLDSLIQYGKASTQFSTDTGKFIDLVFYNNQNIIVFENKIFHAVNNPFNEYVADINNKYLNHKKFFVLLSYKNETSFDEWKYISIREKFNLISQKINFQFTNKWDYFVKEFLTHFSYNKLHMTETEKEFYEKNFAKIIAANNNLTQYILNIGTSFVEENKLNRFELSSNWNSETKAIRFYPFEDKSNIVLIFKPEGNFKIAVYYYKDYYQYNNLIYDIVGINNYRNWKEGNVCCFAQFDGMNCETLIDALNEGLIQIERMRKYYG